MIRQEQVRAYVDKYAALTLESSRIKERMDWLKGYFETLAADDLKDTKLLTASYWDSQNSRVTVTNAATVKPVSLTMVKEVLGKVAGDFRPPDPENQQRPQGAGHPAEAAQGHLQLG